MVTGVEREKRYTADVKKSTNGSFASVKALAGAISPFIDCDRALVEQVVREMQEKIPLFYESN